MGLTKNNGIEMYFNGIEKKTMGLKNLGKRAVQDALGRLSGQNGAMQDALRRFDPIFFNGIEHDFNGI